MSDHDPYSDLPASGNHVLLTELCQNTLHWAESFGILVHRQSIKSREEGRTNEGCGRGTRIFARATVATVP
jgi:hypothetical protein